MASQSIQSKSLIAAVLVLACLGGGYYVYTSLWPNYTEAKAQLDVAQAENDRLALALSSIEDFVKDYNNEVKEAKDVDLLLPSKNPDVANFISNLSDLASQSGVALASFQVTEPAQKSPEFAIQPIDISFGSSGTYLSLKDFISKMQTNIRLLDIYSLTLSAQQNEVGTPILLYQIKLRTYYQQ